MKVIIDSTRKTTKVGGRTSEIQQQFTNTLLLAVAATPSTINNQEENRNEQELVPTRSKRLKLLGMPKSSGHRIMKKMESKRESMKYQLADQVDWNFVTRKIGF